MSDAPDELIRINAELFQAPLLELLETLAQKVKREMHQHLAAPGYVPGDIFMLVRQARATFAALSFINADVRQKEPEWEAGITAAAAPLVRNLIDVFFNISFILLDPAEHGRAFRLAGFRKEIRDLEDDEARYGGQPKWDRYLKERRSVLSLSIRQSQLSEADVAKAKRWLTLGKYAEQPLVKGQPLTDHQRFFARFTHLMWREYSAMAHGGFEGLLDTAPFFAPDAFPHQFRPAVRKYVPRMLSSHMLRGALLLLCICTEIQLRFRFRTESYASPLKERLCGVWAVILPVFEVREVFTEHYRQKLEDRRLMCPSLRKTAEDLDLASPLPES